MKASKLILKITLIIALLINSAGPGYALRPMAAVHSVKMSSAGILKDEVLNVLPEADQRRIDASVRFIEHVIKIAALSDLDLQRLRDRDEFFAFDNIPAEKVLSFIEGLKKKNAVLDKIDTSWEEDFILFLGKHHALFQDIKLTLQFSCHVHYEARARKIPGCEILKGIYEGIDMLVNSLLFDKTSKTDEIFFRTAKALEALGLRNDTLAWSQGGLDRIALYAERKDDSELTLAARKFLSYFVDNLFDSAAMSYAFMFNRSIMEGFLEPDYAKENNVGVVYLFSGSQHLDNQARQIAEEKGLDTSRLHKFYMNRKISEKDPEILRDYIEQEGLSRYKTLIIVDTGFHGSSACRFYDIISILPKHPEHIEARLLALNIKHRPFTYGKMKVCGWNNLIWSLNPELAATTTNSIFFLAHILDNSLPGKFRSPARLYRDSPEGDIKPFLIPAELPVLASIVEEAMEKGTKKLLSEGIDYWKTDEEIWDLWLPDGAAENIRKSGLKSSSAGKEERPAPSKAILFYAEVTRYMYNADLRIQNVMDMMATLNEWDLLIGDIKKIDITALLIQREDLMQDVLKTLRHWDTEIIPGLRKLFYKDVLNAGLPEQKTLTVSEGNLIAASLYRIFCNFLLKIFSYEFKRFLYGNNLLISLVAEREDVITQLESGELVLREPGEISYPSVINSARDAHRHLNRLMVEFGFNPKVIAIWNAVAYSNMPEGETIIPIGNAEALSLVEIEIYKDNLHFLNEYLFPECRKWLNSGKKTAGDMQIIATLSMHCDETTEHIDWYVKENLKADLSPEYSRFHQALLELEKLLNETKAAHADFIESIKNPFLSVGKTLLSLFSMPLTHTGFMEEFLQSKPAAKEADLKALEKINSSA